MNKPESLSDQIMKILNDNADSPELNKKKIAEVLKDLNIDTSSCHNQFALIDQAAKESEKLAASQILIVR